MRFKNVRGFLVGVGMVVFPSVLFALEGFVESKSVRPGQTAVLQVYVKAAQEIGCVAFDVEYDETQLTLLNAIPGKTMEGALWAMNPETFPGQTGLFRFNAVAALGFTGDGALVKLSFKVSEEAQGELPVVLKTFVAATIDFEDIPAVKRDGAFFVETAVSEGENTEAVPEAFQLLSNYPNPFNAGTHIPYQLPEDADVVIRIYNVDGQLVRTLNLGQQSAGYYLAPGRAVYWDGLDHASRKIGSGVYFCTLKAGRFVSTWKAVMLK